MAENFTKAIKEGLTTEEVTLPGTEGYDYTTPDAKMFEALEKSVYQFSAAKSYQINQALSELLKPVMVSGVESSPSFSQFETAARQKLGVYVDTYGKVEYNAAVAASQMSAKWGRFQESADTMPYLQFKTSKGEHVCPICAPYDDMIRPINDPVWEYASPLLHFNCYCTILQLPNSTYIQTPDETLPDPELIPAMFRTNYARKSQALPPDHPYYTGVPKKSLNTWAKENLPKRS